MSESILTTIASLPHPMVVVAVGVPGSGKSTYLKPLAEQVGMVRINLDDLRKWLLRDATNQSFNPQIWQIAKLAITTALSAEQSVVVDGMNTQRKYREEEVAFYRSGGAKTVIALVFNTPLEICLQRNAARSRQVPETAIIKEFERLQRQPVVAAEGFDRVIPIVSQ